MRLIRPASSIYGIYSLDHFNPLESIELAGRTCYKSEDNIRPGTAEEFVKMVIKRGHESVIEHSSMTVKFICDRGVTHELVRHRLCAFSQESTRYCNYKGGTTFIIPFWLDLEVGEWIRVKNYILPNSKEPVNNLVNKYGNEVVQKWLNILMESEITYQYLLDEGWSPQQARSVLPNSLKTEIVVTANFREWRHIFKLRCSRAAHPQIREVMIPVLLDVQRRVPILFDDLVEEVK